MMAFGFVLLAVVVAIHPGTLWAEGGIDRDLAAVPNTRYFDLERVLTQLGSAVVVTAAAIVLAAETWVRGNRRRLAVACVVGVGLAGASEHILKPIVARARPLTSSIVGESGFGFPSGHATGAAALGVCALVIVWSRVSSPTKRRWTGAAVAVYVLTIGISRVVIGAHRAADVVGGWLIGAVIAGFVMLVGSDGIRPLRREPESPSPQHRNTNIQLDGERSSHA